MCLVLQGWRGVEEVSHYHESPVAALWPADPSLASPQPREWQPRGPMDLSLCQRPRTGTGKGAVPLVHWMLGVAILCLFILFSTNIVVTLVESAILSYGEYYNKGVLLPLCLLSQFLVLYHADHLYIVMFVSLWKLLSWIMHSYPSRWCHILQNYSDQKSSLWVISPHRIPSSSCSIRGSLIPLQ